AHPSDAATCRPDAIPASSGGWPRPARHSPAAATEPAIWRRVAGLQLEEPDASTAAAGAALRHQRFDGALHAAASEFLLRLPEREHPGGNIRLRHAPDSYHAAAPFARHRRGPDPGARLGRRLAGR